ncbi:ABC transporter substrate-binding protein [Pelagibacterium lentulum]|uniref:ABC transporter substrate-binding protein n=1 Tax=Pelagibacterium lentulum TaxID=2029865 RepID=A0A916RQK8_9HYPH|nr:ABC transporter substrate-binding protein [Pelagibacterium lentulum]GGA62566.1 ABC transporter substrate-binding protein [Pelagibacterium lentulum]
MKYPVPGLFISALCLFASFAAPAATQQFPLTIEHKFGTTIIEAKPKRVATVDYAGADDLLALGVQPVVFRYWYGDYPRALWPWAGALLEETPPILRGDIDFEQVAAVDPDVIIALWSGITEDDYQKLSLIAPVVAVPEGEGDFNLPWDRRALLTGRALGLEEPARQQVAAINERLADIAAGRPEWTGKTVAIAHAWRSAAEPGAYTSNDVRMQILEQMGFLTAPAVDALMTSGDEFSVALSPEDLSPIDADLLIWLTTGPWDNVINMAAHPFLAATREARDVYVGAEITGAFSHSSLLSLPYAIDTLASMIEVALDGDPTTHADDRPVELARASAQ